VEGDVHWRKNLPYYSTTHAGDGFVLVGDAAAFIDPFYSPGMDWMSFTTYAATEIISAQQRGEDVSMLVEKHNRDFVRSHARWFNALYKDKYDYMGDFELMRTAFLLDLGLYYLGVAGLLYKEGHKALGYGVFVLPPSVPVYHLMRTYNRRMAAIARARRERGTFGRMNDARRFMFGGFTFERDGMNSKHLLKALMRWGYLEVIEGWRSWFAEKRKAAPLMGESPAPATTPA
jgi:hypothetical protein